jgi:hypothetical protein
VLVFARRQHHKELLKNSKLLVKILQKTLKKLLTFFQNNTQKTRKRTSIPKNLQKQAKNP